MQRALHAAQVVLKQNAEMREDVSEMAAGADCREFHCLLNTKMDGHGGKSNILLCSEVTNGIV